MIGNRREIITLQPGQLSYSIRFLSQAWDWSPNRVRRFLSDLAMDSSVTTETDTPQTLITLCNYEKYQRPFGEADTSTDTATNTNKKELKERKNSALPKSEPEGFQDWYAIYPKKKQAQSAKRAFAKVIGGDRIELPVLMERTRAFAAATNWAALSERDRKFIPYPASWLNSGAYDDAPEGGGEASPVPIDPLSFDDDGWRRRLKYFHQAEKWLEAWGPKPGEPGCLIPPHLILAPVSNSKGAA
jgi:hypothetical protein